MQNPLLNYMLYGFIVCFLITCFNWNQLGFLGAVIYLILGSIVFAIIAIISDLIEYFNEKLKFVMITGYTIALLVVIIPIKDIVINLVH